MYYVIRQNRKTIAISIDDALKVCVKAPWSVSDTEIEMLLQKKKEWLEKATQHKMAHRQKCDWLAQGEIPYLGTLKKINVKESKNHKSCIKLIDECFYMEVPNVQDVVGIKQLMAHYRREEARKLFTELTNTYCGLLGCRYNKITIRKQKTRWGSCSSKGNIAYNVKLLGAPLPVIEYVILHEVAHLKHFNHSQCFWDEVERHMQDYKKRQQYLKENHCMFNVE
ncbi:MAG: M48 family metallopeptidase [Cellulosilyticaceae bacterium]